MVMLLDAIDVPTWCILLPLLFILLYIYGTYPYSHWKQLGYPDGPAATPFMGTMTQMFDPKVGTIACINKWKDLYGRFIPTFCFRDPALIILDQDALRQIFIKDFHIWTDRYFLGHGDLQQRIVRPGLFFAAGEQWRRIRKIMSPTFTSGKLRLMTYYMNLTSVRLVQKLKDSAQQGTPTRAKVAFGAFALDVIGGVAFGLNINSQDNSNALILKHAQSLMSFESDCQFRLTLAGVFPFLSKVFKLFDYGFFRKCDVDFFEDNIQKLIQQRKTEEATDEKQADFLKLLLKAEAAESDDIIGARKLTSEEVTAQGIVFLIAGYETTSSTLQFLMYELSKRHDIQEQLLQEINDVLGEEAEPTLDTCRQLKYMEAVINETLRMYPPIHLISRLAGQDTTLNGRPVPKGTVAIFPFANIGRDPEFFPEPMVFKPERFSENAAQSVNSSLFPAFGFGPRQCIGLRLAMMEMKVALVHILRSVRIVRAMPEKLELEDYSGVLVAKVPIELHLELVHSADIDS